MKNIIPIALICTSCLVTIPSRSSALDSPKISYSFHGVNSLLLAQFRRHHDRRYQVYYRNARDSRWTWNWIFGGIYANRQDAERAARRWGNRGYKTSIRVREREANRHDDWNHGGWRRDR